MKIRFLILLIAVIRATANPVLTADVEKIEETCIVAIDHDYAHVSCHVEYRVVGESEGEVWIRIPIAFTAGYRFDYYTDLLELVNARLETNGKVYLPARAGLRGLNLPPKQVYFHAVVFKLHPLESEEFSITVTYRQPMHDSKFHYIPIFEGGGPSDGRFNMYAFPLDPFFNLDLQSDNSKIIREGKRQIAIRLVDEEIVSIELQRGYGYPPKQKTIPKGEALPDPFASGEISSDRYDPSMSRVQEEFQPDEGDNSE